MKKYYFDGWTLEIDDGEITKVENNYDCRIHDLGEGIPDWILVSDALEVLYQQEPIYRDMFKKLNPDKGSYLIASKFYVREADSLKARLDELREILTVK